MAELKRDRVGRMRRAGNKRGAIILPIDSPAKPGEEVTLVHVEEKDINWATRDPDKMYDPHAGTGIGDAVFDAGFGEGWKATAGEPGSAFVPTDVCDADLDRP